MMVKCFKQILDMSRLVLNNPVNSRHTKLDKSRLVLSCNNIPIENLHGEMYQTNTRHVKTCLDLS